MTADRIAFPAFLLLVAVATALLVAVPAMATGSLTCQLGTYGAIAADCPAR